MSDAFIGEIRLFAGSFAPANWMLCNGQLLPISQNTALFSILGTTYGGNGQTTFALPNLQGSVPMHWGTAPSGTRYDLGQTGGTENVTLLSNEMPAHSHLLNASNGGGDKNTPGGNVLAVVTDSASGNPYPGYTAATGNLNASMAPQVIAATGGSLPHNNMQPYLCVSFVICFAGIFPSRN